MVSFWRCLLQATLDSTYAAWWIIPATPLRRVPSVVAAASALSAWRKRRSAQPTPDDGWMGSPWRHALGVDVKPAAPGYGGRRPRRARTLLVSSLLAPQESSILGDHERRGGHHLVLAGDGSCAPHCFRHGQAASSRRLSPPARAAVRSSPARAVGWRPLRTSQWIAIGAICTAVPTWSSSCPTPAPQPLGFAARLVSARRLPNAVPSGHGPGTFLGAGPAAGRFSTRARWPHARRRGGVAAWAQASPHER